MARFFFAELLLVLLPLPALAQGVVVVEGGSPRASVILGAAASAEEREAANELTAYVKTTTGAVLPVGDSSHGTRIHVGLALRLPTRVKVAGTRPMVWQVNGNEAGLVKEVH